MSVATIRLSTEGLVSLAQAIEAFRRSTAARKLEEQRMIAAFGEAVKAQDFSITFSENPTQA